MNNTKTVKSFSLSPDTIKVLEELEELSFTNISKFADYALRNQAQLVLAQNKRATENEQIKQI